MAVRKKLKSVDEVLEQESALDLAAEFDLPNAISDPEEIEEEDKAKMIALLVAEILKDILIEETIESAILVHQNF